MLDTSILCSLLILVGGIKRAYKLTVTLIIFVITLSLMQFVSNDLIYNTSLIVSISLFARYIQNKVIKLALFILTLYFFISFIFAVVNITMYSEMSWVLTLSWFNLYVYVYYATISLIFIGLIIGGKGGRRIGSTGSNMFHSDYRSINYQRIRSKFN
jgi:hypothetical protein